MKGELQDRRSRALTIAGAMLGLLGVAALPLGVVCGELAELHGLVDQHRTLFQEKWDEFFSR